MLILTGMCYSSVHARTKNKHLIRNIKFIESTEVNKYNWDDPATNYLVLDKIQGELTKNELYGLKQYALNAWLPTHNSMNYYFRKRSNSYMLEWLYKKDKDIALLNRAILIAQRAIAFRNDNIEQVDDRYTSYKISFDRSIAPLWPNYKELEIYEDGTHGLAPGASAFAGVPMITVPVRMIAENKALWNKVYQGKTYKEIGLELAKEAQKTIDYTYDIFVDDDNLIRYPETMQRSEWHNNVFIYNRVFPVLTGAIPLAEAYELFDIHPGKVKEIDNVNQAMLNFLFDDITFFTSNGKECMTYPYSDEAHEKNPDQSEDFTHGSFDSRDFQLFFKSERYNFSQRYVDAMANTLVEVLDKGDGKFAGRLNGEGEVSKGTPINYDGFIWYATWRPEVYKIIVEHILKNNIARQEGKYDAYCLFEILKLKEQPKLIYSNDFSNKSSLHDWVMEGPGVVKLVDGKLVLHSKYSEETQAFLNKESGKEKNGTGYYNFVEKLVRKELGKGVDAYKMNGNFVGGHIVYWNKTITPENYILECDFQSISDYSLHMLMFSHLGVNGESVFSPELKKRNGLAAQYTKSDMVGYRVSFFAPNRNTTNLRKSPGKELLIKGKDYSLDDKKSVHHLKVIKNKNTVTWKIDGKTAFVYTEKEPEKELGGGYFAIRLMVPAMGYYDNLKVYEIRE